jgi:hypothetical protein
VRASEPGSDGVSPSEITQGHLGASAVNGVTFVPRSKKHRLWLDYLAYLAIRSVVAFAQMLSIEQSYALAGFLG